ncbi:MAG: twin-arginine translocase subunit TatC [Polyangia bacterium]
MSGQDDAGQSDKTIVTEFPTDLMADQAAPAVAPAAAEPSTAAPATIETGAAVPATIETATVAPATIQTAAVAAATIQSAPVVPGTAEWTSTSSEMRADSSPAAAPASASETTSDRPTKEGLDGKRMSLLEHLGELRSRLRNAGIAFVVAMIGSFALVERYFDWLTRPVRTGMRAALPKEAGDNLSFYAKSLTEPFWVYMKLAIVGGLILAGPFVFWELWKFVAPGLYRKEKRLTMLIIGSTVGCFAAGSVFAYLVLCQPAAYFLTKLLTGFQGDAHFHLSPMIMMDEVANFQMMTLAGCGLAFELPVLLSILGWIGLISSRGLFKFNRYAIVLAVVLGGVLTPSTDPFTQCLLAAPIFLLYNISILVVWLIERARRRRDEALDRGEPLPSG